MPISRGIIKLSLHQAECSRTHFAALCLKYIICTLAAAAILVLWARNYDKSSGLPMLLCSGAGAAMSIYFRTLLRYRMFTVSSEYLQSGGDSLREPNLIALTGCGAAVSAVRTVAVLALLFPSAFCFYSGLNFYGLSGRRNLFLLMLGASLCLLLAGLILASITLTRLDCAEYLFFSGECGSIFSALERSYLITEEGCGDGLILNILLSFCGISVSALCRMNMAARLNRIYLDKQPPTELYFELEQDRYGEQWIELKALRVDF